MVDNDVDLVNFPTELPVQIYRQTKAQDPENEKWIDRKEEDIEEYTFEANLKKSAHEDRGNPMNGAAQKVCAFCRKSW